MCDPAWQALDELTIGEAALLAGVISNPEGNNPFTLSRPGDPPSRRRAARRGRRRATSPRRRPTPPTTSRCRPCKPPAEQRPTNYLVAEVQDRLLADTRLGSTAKERLDKVLKGGLKVYTTFDQNLQNLADRRDEQRQAAVRSPTGCRRSWRSIRRTGAVKAMVGGPDFAESQYNIATSADGRQTGSTWKVITLAAALENGYSPTDIVDGSSPCSVPGYFGDGAPTTNPDGGRPHRPLGGDRGLGELRVRASRRRASGYDKVIDDGPRHGHHPEHPRSGILNAHLGTSRPRRENGHGDGDDRQRRRAPQRRTSCRRSSGPTARWSSTSNRAPAIRCCDPDVAACEQNMLRGVITGGTGTATPR